MVEQNEIHRIQGILGLKKIVNCITQLEFYHNCCASVCSSFYGPRPQILDQFFVIFLFNILISDYDRTFIQVQVPLH